MTNTHKLISFFHFCICAKSVFFFLRSHDPQAIYLKAVTPNSTPVPFTFTVPLAESPSALMQRKDLQNFFARNSKK